MPKVLVVDDEPLIVDIIREFLTLAGHEVLTASSGPEALQKVWEDSPGVVLLDIRTPQMDGLEVLRQIRARAQRVGVIVVTGVREEEKGRVALLMGASGYITKPLDLADVERSVQDTVAATGLA